MYQSVLCALTNSTSKCFNKLCFKKLLHCLLAPRTEFFSLVYNAPYLRFHFPPLHIFFRNEPLCSMKNASIKSFNLMYVGKRVHRLKSANAGVKSCKFHSTGCLFQSLLFQQNSNFQFLVQI